MQSLTYDSDTVRIAESDGFEWDYLPETNLKASLTYPNGATAGWDYEPTRDLLGRRTAIAKSGTMMAVVNETQHYGYNVRDELIFGQNQTYAYDDIGNRTAAEGKTYVANNLNQYTAIDDFVPEYDADGNQTLIKTETGVWSVVYNAENRPVRWTQGDTVITMAFDRLGRRVEYCETRAGQVATHFRFVYDNFLCVQRLDAANGNAVRSKFVWDPTESIATRPLVFQPASGETAYYFHDGNKNVSEVFYHALQDGIAAHYDYAPFGTVTRTAHATRVTNRDLLSENPFRFSSEYHDSTLGLVYYNYRFYMPFVGRWNRRDLSEYFGTPLYAFLANPINYSDFLGLLERTYVEAVREIVRNCNETCPKMANWQAGLDYLDELLVGGNENDYLGMASDKVGSILDILSSSENAKDAWNTLTESLPGNSHVDITFEAIRTPLEKIKKKVDQLDVASRLKNASTLVPSEKLNLLNDILDVVEMSKVPILDSYFNNTFGVLAKALEQIETNYTDSRFRDLSTMGDCATFRNFLEGSGRLGSTEKLAEALKMEKD